MQRMKNPYLRLVPACVFLQYTYEAQQQGMSLNQYIGWLKRKEQEQADTRQQRIL